MFFDAILVFDSGVFRVAPPIWIAEELLRKTLDMPYLIGEIEIEVEPRYPRNGFATTIRQDYDIIFDVWSKQDKCLLRINFYFDPESEKWMKFKTN